MKKLHLTTIILTIVIGLFCYQCVNVIISNPQINLYSDWPGHFDKAKKLDWPWKGGWDTTFWGGYPTVTYPLLSHVLIRSVLTLTKSEYMTVMVVALTTFLLQISGLIALSHSLAPNKRFLRSLFIIASIVLCYYIPGDQLGSFIGTIVTGGIPAGIGLALFFFYLSTKNPYLKALLLGLILLTHTLTAFLSLGIALIESLINSAKAIAQKKSITAQLFIPLVGGMVIGSPWWLTQIDPSFQGITTNLNADLFSIITPLSILVIAFMIEYKVFNTLFISLIVSTLLSIIPFNVSHWLQQHGLRGLHFYRFQIMFYFVCISALTQMLNLVKKRDLSKVVFSFVSLFCCLGLLKNQYGTATFTFNQMKPTTPDHYTRFMDISGLNQTGNFMRVAPHVLASSQNMMGSVGLFYESSQHGPLYYSLAKSINPEFYANGTYNNFFEDYATDSGKLDLNETAKILGISQISYFSSRADHYGLDGEVATIGGIRRIGETKNSMSWHLATINDTKLIESLSQLPPTKKNLDLGVWWFDQTDRTTLARADYQVPPQINLNQPPIAIHNISPTKLSFEVNSATPSPVLLKFTHNRYWKNVTNPNAQPIWITPGHMLVFASGKTTLVWEPPLYLTLAWILSLFTAAYTITRIKRP